MVVILVMVQLVTIRGDGIQSKVIQIDQILRFCCPSIYAHNLINRQDKTNSSQPRK